MKVYELMDLLSGACAGAEVSIIGHFTDKELADATNSTQIIDTGEALKCLVFEVSDIEDADTTCMIYIE
ncbi:MAG: hypothetical protein IKO53_05080 [Lachnospiraceae bacterium]|nr:hypothetical protein [Lachnospiraceae bacterium]